MEKVRPWCGQPSDRGRLKITTEHGGGILAGIPGGANAEGSVGGSRGLGISPRRNICLLGQQFPGLMRLVILMTDARRVKRCVVMITTSHEMLFQRARKSRYESA